MRRKIARLEGVEKIPLKYDVRIKSLVQLFMQGEVIKISNAQSYY